MKNNTEETLRDKIDFWIVIFWCVAVFGSYYWLNKSYYIEKLSVFIEHLKGMGG
jgi:hypothetical protein